MTGPDPRSGVDEHGVWTPAFEGQREPFQRGHELSTRHGFYADIFRPNDQAEVGAIADWLADQMGPELAGERFDAQRLLTAARIWRWRRGYRLLSETEDMRSASRSLLRDLNVLERTIQRDLHALGLTPLGRSVLGLNIVRATSALEEYVERVYGAGDGA